MSVDLAVTPIARIGETAGMLWQYLDQNGSGSVTGLAQELSVPRDLAMQAIGWLAREEKIDITEAGRIKTVTLKTS